MRFSPFFFRTTLSRVGMASCGQPTAKDGGTAWQPPATHAPDLGPTSDSPLSWSPGHTLQLEGAADLGEVGEDARGE